MDKTRAGKGCGSCKLLVAQVVEFAAGGAVEEDPAAHYYVPGIPMDKPALMDGDPDPDLNSPSAGLRRAGPGRRRGRQVQDGPGLAAEDDVGRGLRRREGRPVHQRPGARQHPEGRHLLGGAADARRGHHPGPVAADRRRGRQVRGADGQAHRRSADRPARHQEGGPARGLGRPGHALGLRVRQVASARSRPASGRSSAGSAPATRPSSASRSRPGCRAWSRRPR